MQGRKLNLRGVIQNPNTPFIDSPAMDSMIQAGAWVLWAVNSYRDWGKSPMKDAIIVATGMTNLFATYKLLQR